MRWWRLGLAMAALTLVVTVARGTSPITWVDRRGADQPPEARQPPSLDVDAPPIEPPAALTISFGLFLLIMAGLVLVGLVGVVLAIEVPRWRRRGKGTKGIEIGEAADYRTSALHRAQKALMEFTEHPQRPPRDAVIAAWLALEDTRPRAPHQTPTEFTEQLGIDATVLRSLYQRARFADHEVTEQEAAEAQRELARIVSRL